MRIPVFVSDWQHECCGEMFAVGSSVAWRLGVDEESFSAKVLADEAPSWSQHLPIVDSLKDLSGYESGGTVLGTGDLRVFARIDTTLTLTDQGALVRGPLLEDHHVTVPEEVAPTLGVVKAIRKVAIAYEQGATPQDLVPAPGSARLTKVVETQRWNSDDDGRRFIGFLVDLAVDV
ncbi:DUF6578 domain-containing protein [Quadrisphaera granulorum]|nr:DUF6578 domain-containing protein [Quadrisphaera granulorum]